MAGPLAPSPAQPRSPTAAWVEHRGRQHMGQPMGSRDPEAFQSAPPWIDGEMSPGRGDLPGSPSTWSWSQALFLAHLPCLLGGWPLADSLGDRA